MGDGNEEERRFSRLQHLLWQVAPDSEMEVLGTGEIVRLDSSEDRTIEIEPLVPKDETRGMNLLYLQAVTCLSIAIWIWNSRYRARKKVSNEFSARVATGHEDREVNRIIEPRLVKGSDGPHSQSSAQLAAHVIGSVALVSKQDSVSSVDDDMDELLKISDMVKASSFSRGVQLQEEQILQYALHKQNMNTYIRTQESIELRRMIWDDQNYRLDRQHREYHHQQSMSVLREDKEWYLKLRKGMIASQAETEATFLHCSFALILSRIILPWILFLSKDGVSLAGAVSSIISSVRIFRQTMTPNKRICPNTTQLYSEFCVYQPASSGDVTWLPALTSYCHYLFLETLHFSTGYFACGTWILLRVCIVSTTLGVLQVLRRFLPSGFSSTISAVSLTCTVAGLQPRVLSSLLSRLAILFALTIIASIYAHVIFRRAGSALQSDQECPKTDEVTSCLRSFDRVNTLHSIASISILLLSIVY